MVKKQQLTKKQQLESALYTAVARSVQSDWNLRLTFEQASAYKDKFNAMRQQLDSLAALAGCTVEELPEWVKKAKKQEAYATLVGYVVTCQRTNTREWMHGLEDAINRSAAIAGDKDRVVLNSDAMAMWIKRSNDPADAIIEAGRKR